MWEYLERLAIEAQEARAEAQRLFNAYERTPGNALLKCVAEGNRRHAEHLHALIAAYRAQIPPLQEHAVGP